MCACVWQRAREERVSEWKKKEKTQSSPSQEEEPKTKETQPQQKIAIAMIPSCYFSGSMNLYLLEIEVNTQTPLGTHSSPQEKLLHYIVCALYTVCY